MPIERAVFHSSAWSVYWTAPGAAPAPVSLTPVAQFTAAQQKPTSTVSFDASTSYETGGSIVSYTWNFGDGTSSVSTANTTVLHGYAKAGSYSATLTVADASGKTASVTKSISVVLNQVPVASFSDAISGLTVSVDASGSYDPDGAIASYAWDFGDGATATGITAAHTYTAGGTFSIVLKVTDGAGASSTTSKSVSLSSGPVAAFTSAVGSTAPSTGSYTYADLSRYDGTVTWSAYTLPGAILKLGGSNSGTYTDANYLVNVAGARQYKKHLGHYWFNGTGDPTADANYFVNALSQYQDEDFLILDVEAESGTTGTPWTPSKALTWFQTVKALKPNARLMVYMNDSTTTTADWSSLVNYGVKLWVASWGANDGKLPTTKPVPSYWPTYTLWQYTSVGTTGGVGAATFTLGTTKPSASNTGAAVPRRSN